MTVSRRIATILIGAVAVGAVGAVGVVGPPVGAAPTDGFTISVVDGQVSSNPTTASTVDLPVTTGAGFVVAPPVGGVLTAGTWTTSLDAGPTDPWVINPPCTPTGPLTLQILQLEHSGGAIDRFAARLRTPCADRVVHQVSALHATVPVPALFVADIVPTDPSAYVGEPQELHLSVGNAGNVALSPSMAIVGAATPGLVLGPGTCPASLPPLASCTLTATWTPTSRGDRPLRLGVVSEASTWAGPIDAIGRGPVRLVSWDRPAGDGFRPMAPTRLLDTRFGIGGPAAPIDQTARRVTVAGREGIPSNATAVLANITVTEPTAAGFLTLWPAGRPMPLVSNLNFVAGETAPNTSLLALGVGGAVDVFTSSGISHVIIDVVGWLSPDEDLVYRPLVTPSRLADSRFAGGAIGPGERREFEVAHRELPSDAVALLVNVTGTEPSADTHLTVYGGRIGTVPPNASTLNLRPGQTRPNVAVVDISDLGRIMVRNNAGSTHVVIDLVGWFERPDDPEDDRGRIIPFEPFRAVDSRETGETFGPGDAFGYRFPRFFGDQALEVGGIVFNATVTQPTAPGFLTLFPWDLLDPPFVSNLNFAAGQTVPNQAWVRLAPEPDNLAGVWNGSSGTTEVVLDIQAIVLD